MLHVLNRWGLVTNLLTSDISCVYTCVSASAIGCSVPTAVTRTARHPRTRYVRLDDRSTLGWQRLWRQPAGCGSNADKRRILLDRTSYNCHKTARFPLKCWQIKTENWHSDTSHEKLDETTRQRWQGHVTRKKHYKDYTFLLKFLPCISRVKSI